MTQQQFLPSCSVTSLPMSLKPLALSPPPFMVSSSSPESFIHLTSVSQTPPVADRPTKAPFLSSDNIRVHVEQRGGPVGMIWGLLALEEGESCSEFTLHSWGRQLQPSPWLHTVLSSLPRWGPALSSLCRKYFCHPWARPAPPQLPPGREQAGGAGPGRADLFRTLGAATPGSLPPRPSWTIHRTAVF